jgi:hypothetical protein
MTDLLVLVEGEGDAAVVRVAAPRRGIGGPPAAALPDRFAGQAALGA